MKRILVAGMGNLLRGDDGFGVRVIQRLACLNIPAGIELYEAGGAGIALAQKLMDGFDACIFVDATLCHGAPGTLYRFVPSVPEDPGEIGMHDLGPAKVLALARALNALPGEVLVIGCEPLETDELSEDLSPSVAAAVDGAVQMILNELRHLAN